MVDHAAQACDVVLKAIPPFQRCGRNPPVPAHQKDGAGDRLAGGADMPRHEEHHRLAGQKQGSNGLGLQRLAAVQRGKTREDRSEPGVDALDCRDSLFGSGVQDNGPLGVAGAVGGKDVAHEASVRRLEILAMAHQEREFRLARSQPGGSRAERRTRLSAKRPLHDSEGGRRRIVATKQKQVGRSRDKDVVGTPHGLAVLRRAVDSGGALEQRFGLPPAAQPDKQHCQAVEALSGIGMDRPEHRLTDCERALAQRPRSLQAGEVTLAGERVGQIVERDCSVGVVGAGGFLVDGKCELEQTNDLGVFTLRLQRECKVVDRLGGVGMIQSQPVVQDRQRPAIEGLRMRMITLARQHEGKIAKALCRHFIARPENQFANR